MTTAVKEKKPFLPQRKPAAPRAGAVVRSDGGALSQVSYSGAPILVGGEPRVHLLPVDVKARKKLKELKRRLLLFGVMAVVVVVAGYGFATVTLATAQGQLSDARTQTAQILVQQGKYGEVTKVKADEAAIQNAQKTASAQEILWAPFVNSLAATLPAGATFTQISASIDTPFSTTITPDTTPLQGPHIATVNATLVMAQGTIPGWLNSLPKLKGFVDVTPDSVSTLGAGNYTVVVTIHLNSKALSNRFATTDGSTK